jgi:hypothetical protein
LSTVAGGTSTASEHRERVVYFATGESSLAMADLKRLKLHLNGTPLRIVVPAPQADAFARDAAVPTEQVLSYQRSTALLLWLRLMTFLGFSHARIICLSGPQNFRFLKFLALTLRGHGVFSRGEGNGQSLSLMQLYHIQITRAREERDKGKPIAVMGSASTANLETIVEAVRARSPNTPVHGWLSFQNADTAGVLFDEVHIIRRGPLSFFAEGILLLRANRSYLRWVVPCTDEPFYFLKALVLIWPLRRRQIFNELADEFPLRNLRGDWEHLRWRFLVGDSFSGRVFHWKDVPGTWLRQFLARCDRRLSRLPIAVIGSASGLYLEKIVAVLRSHYPGVPIHGFLAPRTIAAAAHLFDATEIIRSWKEGLRLIRASRKYQSWVVPCTGEPFPFLKTFGLLWPLRRRSVYNELADGFAVRDLANAWRHFRWRLRDQLTFQFIFAARGTNWLERSAHIALYGVRLMGAIPLLWKTRYRSRRRSSTPSSSWFDAVGKVDLIVLELAPHAPAGSRKIATGPAVDSVRRVTTDSARNLPVLLDQAIRESRSQFICLLDQRCVLNPSDWLERLLSCFDETTALVGPQVRPLEEDTIFRGGVFLDQNTVDWNRGHAVRCHASPDLLEVALLPWTCLVIRRSAYLQSGGFSNLHWSDGEWFDARFCRRLAERGWLALCNFTVTATYLVAVEKEGKNVSNA